MTSSGATLFQPAVVAAFAFASCALAVHLITGWLIPWLRQAQLLDHPNARSSHSTPTPRGGGLAVTGVLMIALLGTSLFEPVLVSLLAGTALLAWISLMDDRVGLSAGMRLIGQAAAVAAGLLALPAEQPIFQGVMPFWLDRAAAGLAWLWFVNLYNFMDGIDGITAVETLVIGVGASLVSMLAGDDVAAVLALALAGAAAGFLRWNWSPARVFLGDVGSVPIGFIGGFLLLALAARGAWAAALILPAYYLADATLTLLRRLLRGERVWEAHRSHFYQRAALAVGHAPVSARVAVLGVALVAAAVASERAPWWAVTVAGGGVAMFLVELVRLSHRR